MIAKEFWVKAELKPSDISDTIKHIRKDILNLSVGDFSREIGVDYRIVQMYENGGKPGVSVLDKICKRYKLKGYIHISKT
jgi:DNA-binding transcriptional regulator YiaG